jgi:hypothetical protein
MSRLTRRSVVLGAMLAPLTAQAQNWPSGPDSGSSCRSCPALRSMVGRPASAGLQQRLGTTVVVENRPALPVRAVAMAAKAPPDGNTWLVVFDTHAVNPTLLPNFPFDNEKDSSR